MGFSYGIPRSEDATEYYKSNQEIIYTNAARIRRTAEMCPDWKKGLQLIFPDAFTKITLKKENWIDDWL
jgi:hypothetical protein